LNGIREERQPQAIELGLLAVGVVISDSVESLVGLHHLARDFLFFGIWSIELRGGFQLTHHPVFCFLDFSHSHCISSLAFSSEEK